MLDIIFGTRVFDVGAYYKIGSFTSNIPSIVSKNQVDTFSSTVEKATRAATVAIKNINKKFAEIKDGFKRARAILLSPFGHGGMKCDRISL